MIHPTAVVDPRAEIDAAATIGAYAIVEGAAKIGPGTRLWPHAVVTGGAVLGERNEVHYGAVIGHVPQDLAFGGEESFLRIGDDNVFREHCEVHRGTKPGSATVIGNGNYLMARSHVAHNCRVGDQTIIASGALLSGYVELGDRAIVSGNCVVHQFVRIGRLAMLRGLSRTSRDVPPFCIMDWTHTVRALNRVGLRRAGVEADALRALQRTFKTLFLAGRNLADQLALVERGEPTTPEVRELVEFIRASKRGVCFGPRAGRTEGEL